MKIQRIPFASTPSSLRAGPLRRLRRRRCRMHIHIIHSAREGKRSLDDDRDDEFIAALGATSVIRLSAVDWQPRLTRRCDWTALSSGLGPESLAALRVSLLHLVDLVTGGRHCTLRGWCTHPLCVDGAIVELQPNERGTEK